MISKKQTLVSQRGTTLAFSVRLWQDREKTTPVNLLGHGVDFVVRSAGKPAATAIFSKAAVVTEDGWVHVDITDEETATLPLGLLAWNLDWNTPNGDKHRPYYGPLDVKSGVEV